MRSRVAADGDDQQGQANTFGCPKKFGGASSIPAISATLDDRLLAGGERDVLEPGEPKLTRAERRAINKAASVRRHVHREAAKAKHMSTSPSFPIARAPGAGAGAGEGQGVPPQSRARHIAIESKRPDASVVVLAHHGLSVGPETPPGDHQPTDEKRQAVVVMRANGFTKKAVAAVLGIGEVAFGDHYAFEIENGFALVAAKISSAVALSALNGDQKDQHFWLRSKLGWGGDRAVQIDMGVMETEISPRAAKPWPNGRLPEPGPDGHIHVTMRLGIPDDRLGENETVDDA